MNTGNPGASDDRTRRDFVKKAGVAGSALAVQGNVLWLAATAAPNYDRPICYFTKHLQLLGFHGPGVVLREAGSDGADLTVWPGGHNAPDNAWKVLPIAVRTLVKYGISIPMVVTLESDPDKDGHRHTSP